MGQLEFVSDIQTPYNIWINTQVLYCPLSFSKGPPHSKCGLTCSQLSREPQLVSFSIHVFTQNSVKAEKAVSTANWGSQGNRSCPISSFINQSTLQDLDWEQCPSNGMPSISLLNANAMAVFGSGMAACCICRLECMTFCAFEMCASIQCVICDCKAGTCRGCFKGRCPNS